MACVRVRRTDAVAGGPGVEQAAAPDAPPQQGGDVPSRTFSSDCRAVRPIASRIHAGHDGAALAAPPIAPPDPMSEAALTLKTTPPRISRAAIARDRLARFRDDVQDRT